MEVNLSISIVLTNLLSIVVYVLVGLGMQPQREVIFSKFGHVRWMGIWCRPSGMGF